MHHHEVYELGDVVLQSEATLPDVKLAYKTYGALNADRSSAIVYPTWYSGRHPTSPSTTTSSASTGL